MKCIGNSSDPIVKRVRNEHAEALVATGKWHYCKKTEWKAQVRGEGWKNPEANNKPKIKENKTYVFNANEA